MRYVIAISAAFLITCLIYAGHWAVQARVTKIKSDVGVPQGVDVDLQLPRAWQTAMEIEAFVYHIRFALILITLLGALAVVMLSRKPPGRKEAAP